eukprot:gnl/TRDRNA2_/TRDRNA2_148500_c0_seq1.p2 gnl/TRDRNA2_/TRDRNA2_148500_c0~~gnl/TRDRNA2_/TRDRNA2_148500_c0_seq1.p2  ORF type:complete len:100 (-),score=12.09 gnl/TRDRNA2_/TRDRNA2_148500_c0_seq1:67-366(-)
MSGTEIVSTDVGTLTAANAQAALASCYALSSCARHATAAASITNSSASQWLVANAQAVLARFGAEKSPISCAAAFAEAAMRLASDMHPFAHAHATMGKP